MIRCSTFTFIAILISVIIAVVTGQYPEDTSPNYTTYYFIGVAVSLVFWISIAVIGYVWGDWSIAACVLVVLFGILGLCCALAMPKRSEGHQI
uniref:NADH dehydrogenase subunit 6 n=1 Tax=Plectus sambesii TaxID=2011161 RepID=A0A914UUF8_9BILA